MTELGNTCCQPVNETPTLLWAIIMENEKEQPTKKSTKKSKKSSGNESDKIKFKESPKIDFKTIKHQPDLLRLHIEEAIAIKKLKPTLNRRQETLGTGFLP